MAQNDLPPIPARLPVVATTNLVLFPFMIAPLVVGREASLKALDTALAGDRLLAFTLQTDENLDTPTPEQMHVIGCAGTIVRMMRLPDGTAQVIVQGLTRVRLSDFQNEGNVPQRERGNAARFRHRDASDSSANGVVAARFRAHRRAFADSA
jgi:ATP-dependent Lon protease